MSKARRTEAPASSSALRLNEAALASLALTLEGDILAVIAEGTEGIFLYFPPGEEAFNAERLLGVDFEGALKIALEEPPL